jgi:hypothetical protein
MGRAVDDRRYEHMWFRAMCGHNAPPAYGRPGADWLAHRKAREDLLVALADARDGGKPTRDIARDQGWSVSYTRGMLSWGRFYRDRKRDPQKPLGSP